MESNYTRKSKARMTILLLALLVMIVIGLKEGAVPVSLREIGDCLAGNLDSTAGRILLHIRVPRVMGAVIAGAGLAAAGAVIQTILNNPLAGPNIIGVNAGAGFAVVLTGALFHGAWQLLPLSAFAGAFLAVMFVYFFGKKTGASRITIVLVGVALNSLLNAATDTIYILNEDSLLSSNLFKIGGLSGINPAVLCCAGILVAVSLLLLLLLHNELELFSLGEDTARTLGLPLEWYRFLFLGIAAVLAGSAVSFAGLLGFIGLIVPHMARLLCGEESKYLILTSALLGALSLVACDYAARTWFAPYELPVGILLSAAGAPFFIWLLLRRKNRGRNDQA